MDSLDYRLINEDEWQDAIDLVYHIFLKFDAPLFTEAGVEHFRSFIYDPTLKQMFLSGTFPVIAAFDQDRIVGVIALRQFNHISLLFVDESYHMNGIGSQLVREMATLVKTRFCEEQMTVNSSPYAIDFYHRIGFEDTSRQVMEDGIYYTPMKWKLIK